MDDLRLIDALFSLLLLALGAVLQMFREQIKDQKTAHEKFHDKVDQRDAAISADIAKLRNTVSKDYMPRSEVAVLMGDIRGSLQRIEDKLDGKMDKK
jgi:hypothetical protein